MYILSEGEQKFGLGILESELSKVVGLLLVLLGSSAFVLEDIWH